MRGASSSAARRRPPATSTTPPRRARCSTATGSTPAISATWPTPTSTSPVGSKTSSSGPAAICTPTELEEAVGNIAGVRKGCVAVFACPDPGGGAERLVVMAETRATDEEATAALRSEIVSTTVDLLGRRARRRGAGATAHRP